MPDEPLSYYLSRILDFADHYQWKPREEALLDEARRALRRTQRANQQAKDTING